MKKRLILAMAVLLLLGSLCSCFFKSKEWHPDDDSIGDAKTFEKVGLTITLTDKFEEQSSQVGFDAYYVADFCGVMVLKEEFTLEEGLADRPLEEYINNVIKNNGRADTVAQQKDGLWFYEYTTSNGNFGRSYCYKGSDAFYVVQFICRSSDKESLDDMFWSWAHSVKTK